MKVAIGDKEFELGELVFTYRETKIIKDISGVRTAEIAEALKAGDTDLIIAFAVIAGRRNKVELDAETLFDSEIGTISLIADDAPDEGDVLPPAGGPTPSDEAPGARPSPEPPSEPTSDSSDSATSTHT